MLLVGVETSPATILCPAPRYLSTTYDQYQPLLDGSASRDVDAFLKSDEELSVFGKVRTPSLKLH